MFKSILTLVNIRKRIILNKFVKGCSTNSLFDQDEIKKKIDLREQYIKSIELNESNSSKISNLKNDDLLDPKESFSAYAKVPVINSIQDPETNSQVNDTIQNEFEKTTTNQPQTSNDSLQPRKSFEFDELIHEIKQSNNILNLFELIHSRIIHLNSNQINAIFNQINEFSYLSRSTQENFIHFKKTIEQSMVFKLLLNQVNYSLISLDNSCLITILHTFNLLDDNQHSEVMKNTIQILRTKLDSFSLNQINRCLFVLSAFPNSGSPKDNIFKLNQELIEKAKLKILNSEFNNKDINTITRLFHIFLKPENDPDHQVITHLTKQLLPNTTILNLKQSVKILRRIKQSHIEFRVKRSKFKEIKSREIELRYRKSKLYPQIFNELINKCNLSIYESFYLEPNEENSHFYFTNIHDTVDTINYEFANFYDVKLLNFLVPYAMRTFEFKNLYKYYIYNLVANYALFNKFDEQLLKFVYDRYLTNPIFRSKLEFSQFYSIYCKYKFPFVDHQKLAQIVVAPDSSVRLDESIAFRLNSLRLLTKAVLNDIRDETFLNRIINAVDKLRKGYYREVSFKLYKEITLSNVILQLFSDLEPNLKSRMIQKLNVSINTTANVYWRPKTTDSYLQFNDKLQRNGYLSNEIFLDAFGIYDRSKGDFISLTDYTNYFENSVDKIPLTKDQELFTFLETSRPIGNIKEYDTAYNFKLKQVLDHFKINTIKVYLEDYKHLPVEEAVDFLMKKASEFYKS